MKKGGREKMQGLLFEIRNEYGKQLSDILTDIVNPSWYWSIGPGESYKPGGLYKIDKDPKMLEEFFTSQTMNGEAFLKLISTEEYYIIFADLKAFPTSESIVEINSYEDFLKSSCQLALLVIDSVYVSIVLKEQQMIDKFFERAESNGYTNIEFLTDENDTDSLWG